MLLWCDGVTWEGLRCGDFVNVAHRPSSDSCELNAMASETCCPCVNFNHMKEFVNATHPVQVIGKLIHICSSH